jgi:hypothetical protein
VGDPAGDPIAQRAKQELCEVGEAPDRIAILPAAGSLKPAGKITAMQRGQRVDAALEQSVDQALVEVHRRALERAAPIRL